MFFIKFAIRVFLLSLSFAPLFANSVVWENSSAQDFGKGTLVNTVLFSDGSVRDAGKFRAIATPELTLWSSVVDNKGMLYVGTGVKGGIYRLLQDKLEKYFDTGALVVTALAVEGDTLYAATIADGKLFQIENGKGELFVQLPSPYIWAMQMRQGQLYLATGPEGLLYQVDIATRQVKTLARTTEKHLLSLTSDGVGNLYAGSAPNGLLYRISSDGKVTVLVDLPETEIRGLCWADGKLYLAANSAKGFDNVRAVQTLARSIQEQGYKGKALDRKKIWEEMMATSLYQYQENKGGDKIWELQKNFVTAVAPAGQGVFLATGIEGRIYHIQSQEVWAIVADLREEQIMSMATQDGHLKFYGTGDSGTLYSQETVSLPGDIAYLSEIHDSETFAQWGRICYEATGKLLVQTRSGNTQKADELWSEWSAPLAKSMAKVTSPPGRYFQYKVSWQEAGGVLKAVRLIYRRYNRSPVIKSFKIPLLPANNPRKLLGEKATSPVQLSWEAKDPDNDSLRYRLFYKNVTGDVWYELTANQVYTASNFKWDVARVPDSYYLVKLEVSDELDNPTAGVTTQVSTPLLLDNNAPLITADTNGDEIRGSARDSFSQVAQLAYRLEGANEWTLVEPADGIYDEAEEYFRFSLPASLKRPCNIEIKASDAAGNPGYLFLQVKS
jgi:sugar lactone lactonase YvrE